MGQTESKIENIRIVRAMKRIYIGNEVLIGNGNIVTSVNIVTGRVVLKFKNKLGEWIERNGSSEHFEQGYKRRKMPGTTIKLMIHTIIAIALGWYDDDRNLKKIVNHKNGNKADNRVINLELVNHSENTYHNNLRKILQSVGHWGVEMEIEAKFANKAIQISNGNLETLLDLVNTYLRGDIEHSRVLNLQSSYLTKQKN